MISKYVNQLITCSSLVFINTLLVVIIASLQIIYYILYTHQGFLCCFLQGMFLPTMPQDDLEDVKEALLAARQAGGGENPVFYRMFEHLL